MNLGSFFMKTALLLVGLLLFYTLLRSLLHISMTCRESTPRAFEQFTDGNPTLSDYTSRTTKLTAVQESLSDEIGALDDLIQDTCGIVGHVKEAYVGNNSAPLDESEYTYPKDVQAKRMDQRKVRAAQRFVDEKAVFGTLMKKTLLECFATTADSEKEAKEAKDADLLAAKQDLAAAVDQVSRLLDATEIKAALLKAQQLAPTLQFTAKYLKQAGEAVASAPPATMESFVGGSSSGSSGKSPSGAELVASADALLTRAGTIRNTVKDLKAAVQQQKEAVKTLKRVQSEGITPPSG
jgi:hypothetical protein